MPYLMKCSKCGVVGELDEFMEEFDCPNCGGQMFPENVAKKDTSTMSISRAQIDQYKKIKVAKAVNVGFSDFTSTMSTKNNLQTRKTPAPAAPAPAPVPAPAPAPGVVAAPAPAPVVVEEPIVVAPQPVVVAPPYRYAPPQRVYYAPPPRYYGPYPYRYGPPRYR